VFTLPRLPVPSRGHQLIALNADAPGTIVIIQSPPRPSRPSAVAKVGGMPGGKVENRSCSHSPVTRTTGRQKQRQQRVIRTELSNRAGQMSHREAWANNQIPVLVQSKWNPRFDIECDSGVMFWSLVEVDGILKGNPNDVPKRILRTFRDFLFRRGERVRSSWLLR